MSEYCDIKTQFKSEEALIDALLEASPQWTRDMIELHAEPQHLFGYQDDQREQTAHLIIRREHVGGAANDIGFLRGPDGTYTAQISRYDSHRYGERWQGKLKQSYAYHAIRRQQERHGRTVTRTVRTDGKILVTVRGY